MRFVATFSIVACDLETGRWGIAVESKFPAVGAVVPFCEAGVGAVATQSYANPRQALEAVELLRSGSSAAAAVQALMAADPDRDLRQMGIVDANGTGATFTGDRCMEWAGGRTGDGFAAQGNILVSQATVDALADTFVRRSDLSLAARLVAALESGQQAGGDRRGQQSAALLVARQGAGYAGLSDVEVDLRVDDHPQPIAELRRLYELHRRIFGTTPRTEWVKLDEPLRAQVSGWLRQLGFTAPLGESLFQWAGRENLEDRYEGPDELDPVLLDELRAQGEGG